MRVPLRLRVASLLLRPPKRPARFHLERWLADRAAAVPAGALVLDAGAGDHRYKPLFAHAQYESADFLQVEKAYEPPTYKCDLASIPVEDARYDVVVCTQVLEHVPEPRDVLQEFHRVLKPGGELLLSMPLFSEEHEQPYDFYRYTQFALRHLAAHAGFDVESIAWVEGYYGALATQLVFAVQTVSRRDLRVPAAAIVAPAMKIVFAAAARSLAASDRRERLVDRGMCANYRAVFVKPR